jgi:dihydroneopterin aldolase
MNSTKIIVRDFILPARIGIYPEEQKKTQKICVNITMDLADFRIPHDIIEDTVSYEAIINEVRRQSEIHHNLVETLCEHIASHALTDTRVKCVTVQIEKIEIYSDAKVGCCITRARD